MFTTLILFLLLMLERRRDILSGSCHWFHSCSNPMGHENFQTCLPLAVMTGFFYQLITQCVNVIACIFFFKAKY